MNNIDPGYKFSIEVLLNLNHDRYKTYFTQFIVLHVGIFTAMNIDLLAQNIKIPLLAGVGILLCIIWFFVLRKINADIKILWKLIEKHEDNIEQKIKVNESRSPFLSSGKLMLCVPVLLALVYITILYSIF